MIGTEYHNIILFNRLYGYLSPPCLERTGQYVVWLNLGPFVLTTKYSPLLHTVSQKSHRILIFTKMKVHLYGVILASSPGPTQKSGKGPGVTCKYSRMCCVSSLCLE